MIKKHRNTFEGGLDQDTDEKFVKPNTIRNASNFSLTKDGDNVAMSTFLGFQQSTGDSLSINTYTPADDWNAITFLTSVVIGDRLFEISIDGGNIDLISTQAISNGDLTTLESEIGSLLTAESLSYETYIRNGVLYLRGDDFTINTYSSTEYIYIVTLLSTPIAIGQKLFDVTKNGVTSGFNTTSTINNISDLETEVLLQSDVDGTFIDGSNLEIYMDPNVTLSNFHPNISLVDTLTNDLTSLQGSVNSLTGDETIIGFKEISIKDNKRLIFLFKTDEFDGLNIQLIYYDNKTNIIEGNDLIYTGNVPISQIHPDNILYARNAEDNHTLYWVDGVNPDKRLNITVSLDLDDYASFSEYITTIQENISDQVADNFIEDTTKFMGRPYLNSLNESSVNGKIDAGNSLVFFYRMRLGEKTSNISLFSRHYTVPNQSISEDLDGECADFKVIPSANKFSSSFIIPDVSNLNYDEIEPYVTQFTPEGLSVTHKLTTIPNTSGNNIITYNELFNSETAEEVSLTSLFNFQSLFNISKEHIIFKNRRVKANIKDSLTAAFLNYDTRAFRFNSSQEARLEDENGAEETTIDGTASPVVYPTDQKLDAINPFNNEYTDYADWQTNQQYKFQSDGSTIGGEGPNISYTFGTTAINREYLGEPDQGVTATAPWSGDAIEGRKIRIPLTGAQSGITTLPSGQNHINGHRSGITLKGFQGGEVYRFFMWVYKEDKVTPAKWIADIKFPENYTLGGIPDELNLPAVDNPFFNRQLTINFSISNSALDGEASAFAIGYVPRDISNKSVIFTGNDIGMHYEEGGTLATDPGLYFDTTTTDGPTSPLSDNGSLTTPETEDRDEFKKFKCFPFDLEAMGLLDSYGAEGTSYYLKEIGRSGNYDWELQQGSFSNTHERFYTRLVGSNEDSSLGGNTTEELKAVTDLIRFDDVFDPTDIITLNDTTARIYNTSIFSRTGSLVHPLPAATDILLGERYSKTLIAVESAYTSFKSPAGHQLWSLRKQVSNQYGGAGYNSRQSNAIVLGGYRTASTGTVSLSPEGDTFACSPEWTIHNSEVQNSGATKLTAGIRGLTGLFESTCNTYGLYHPDSEDNEQWYWDCYPGGSVSTPVVYADFRDITNRTVIDLISGRNVNVGVPIQRGTIAVNPFGIIISQKRIIGETSDSWTIFFVNDSKTIDPVWGEITKLVDDKDKLYIVQENAVARQLVEQLQQNIDDEIELAVGTGDVAGQHIYLIKNRGSQSNEQVIQLNDDVVLQDYEHDLIMSINQGEIGLISELLQKDKALNVNRLMVYDRNSNILFIPNYSTYDDDSNSYLMSYDNNIRRFVTDKSFEAQETDYSLFTGFTNMILFNGGNMYVFNKNKYPTHPSSNTANVVSFIVNPDLGQVKTFDNLFIDMEVNSYSGNTRSDEPLVMPTSIRVETQYQDTGVVPCTSSNTRRLGRQWKFTIPRNSGTDERIRDYWAKVTIVFPDNYEIILNEVITSYRISNLTRV